MPIKDQLLTVHRFTAMDSKFGTAFRTSAFGIVTALLSVAPGFAQEFASDGMMPNTAHTYRIVPRPLPEHVGKHLPYSTTNQPAPSANLESRSTGPYAYGWFGAKPSPDWSRHFGYSRRYTQWSLK